jgi:hypothetical protein
MKNPENESSNHGIREVEDRLNTYLAGEMDEEQAREFERLLDVDPSLRQRADALLKMNDWLNRTRGPAPDDFAGRVERAINARAASTEAVDSTPSILSRWMQRFRFAWAPTLVGVAVILFFLIRIDPGRIHDEAVEPVGMMTAGSSGFLQRFRFEAANAEEVCLVGDFNGWQICETPLERVDENVWEAKIPLSEGRHEYMFVVDGVWRTDPTASFHIDDGFGNRNAVVYI